jgi:hypothetical protein
MSDAFPIQQLEQAVRLARELEEFAHAAEGGRTDRTSVERVKQLARQIRACGPDGYVLEKLGGVESWADILFSARKHQKWGPDGARHVHGFMYGAACSARTWLERSLAIAKGEAV